MATINDHVAVLISDDDKAYRVIQKRRNGSVKKVEVRHFDSERGEWNTMETIRSNPYDPDDNSLPIGSDGAIRAAVFRLIRIYQVNVDRVVFLPDYGTMTRTEDDFREFVALDDSVSLDTKEISLAGPANQSQ